MNLVISWSGEKSKKYADLFAVWIKRIIQACKPWVSTGTTKGSGWFEEVLTQFKDANIGIVFLTEENKEKPWIMFESGVLIGVVKKGRLFPLLVDKQVGTLEGLLSGIQHTELKKEDIRKLVCDINNIFGEENLDKLASLDLQKIFDHYWPDFQAGDEAIKKDNDTAFENLLEKLSVLISAKEKNFYELPRYVQEEIKKVMRDNIVVHQDKQKTLDSILIKYPYLIRQQLSVTWESCYINYLHDTNPKQFR